MVMMISDGGHRDDGMFYSVNEEAELQRKSRRGWMYAALWVALVLLLTAGIGQMYF